MPGAKARPVHVRAISLAKKKKKRKIVLPEGAMSGKGRCMTYMSYMTYKRCDIMYRHALYSASVWPQDMHN